MEQRYKFSDLKSDAFGNLAKRQQNLLESLRELGFRVNPSGRFDRYRIAVSKALDAGEDGRIGVERGSEESLLRAIIETTELEAIVEQLGRSPEVEGWRPKLQTVLGGSERPSRSRDDPARNIQFELHLAAAARRAGLEVSLAEPDLQLEGGGLPRMAVAAKRLQSRTKLRKRLREASKQLSRAGAAGLIAADVSVGLGSGLEVSRGADLESVGENQNATLRSFVERNADRFRSAVDPRRVHGLLFVTANPCILGTGPRLGAVWIVRLLNLWSEDDPRSHDLERLFDRLRHGMWPTRSEPR